MSTSLAAAISNLQLAGRLWSYVPRSRHSPKRGIYLTERAVREIVDSALQKLAGKAQILGALDTWVLGHQITGDQRRGHFLVPLDGPPPDVWEIKVRAPTIEGRLFVRFLAPNTLLMTHSHTRRLLESGFRAPMDDCAAAWDEHLPGILPFRGNSIHEYVTFNCDDFPHLPRKPKRR